MGHVGHFGKLEFYVKTKNGKPKLQSFSDMKWNTSINVEEHKRQGKKPLLEVTSKNCDEITMNIYFLARYGVKPYKMLLLLRKYNLQSKIFPLGIGGRRIGSYKFLITSISNELKTFYKNGKLTGLMASVTFKEYPYKKGKARTKTKVGKSFIATKTKAGKSFNGKENRIQEYGAVGEKGVGIVSSGTKKKGYISYTVQEWDTLWTLAKKYYNDGSKYSKIYNANKAKTKGFDCITNPNKLKTGWVIKIPV